MEKIIDFVNVSNGYGNGYGYGDGNGSGYGNGSGNGNGSGIKRYNDDTVYEIDNVQTIIIRVCNNIAKGFILNDDLTLTPCYVSKQNDLFAHGKTAKEAVWALQRKLFEELDVEERIDLFLQEFNLTEKYPAMEFFEWHHKLTGSCELGRKTFARNHDIDLENDTFTVSEFIELTINGYEGEIIQELKNKIN